jgi:hypothetical protein
MVAKYNPITRVAMKRGWSCDLTPLRLPLSSLFEHTLSADNQVIHHPIIQGSEVLISFPMDWAGSFLELASSAQCVQRAARFIWALTSPIRSDTGNGARNSERTAYLAIG